jgi:membrane protease YdiL (CAAX protease family)
VQLLPTFTLGLVLGMLALRARSAFPGMLAHFINNALALVVARDDAPWLARAFADHPTAALVGCGGAAALGLGLALRIGNAPRP